MIPFSLLHFLIFTSFHFIDVILSIHTERKKRSFFYPRDVRDFTFGKWFHFCLIYLFLRSLACAFSFGLFIFLPMCLDLFSLIRSDHWGDARDLSHWSECFGVRPTHSHNSRLRLSIDHLKATRPAAQGRFLSDPRLIHIWHNIYGAPKHCQPRADPCRRKSTVLTLLVWHLSATWTLATTFLFFSASRVFNVFFPAVRSVTHRCNRPNFVSWWNTLPKLNGRVSEDIGIFQIFPPWNDLDFGIRSGKDEKRIIATGPRALNASAQFEIALTAYGLLHHVRRIGDNSSVSRNVNVDLVQPTTLHHRTTGFVLHIQDCYSILYSV